MPHRPQLASPLSYSMRGFYNQRNQSQQPGFATWAYFVHGAPFFAPHHLDGHNGLQMVVSIIAARPDVIGLVQYRPGTVVVLRGYGALPFAIVLVAVHDVARGLRGLDVVGADLVEVSPPFDASGGTAWLGISLMFEMLCVMAERVARG